MATSKPPQGLSASLRQNTLFGSLDAAELDRLQQQFEPVHLAEVETLFREGDEGDSLYLLIQGKLGVKQSSEMGTDLTLDQLVPGATVGEMALLTGQKRTATVYAQEDSELLRLSRSEFLNLTEREPEWTKTLFETIKPRLQRAQLARVLNHLLGSIDMETLHTLQSKLEWLNVASGEAIIRQGEIGDEMFIVVNGRLRIVVESNQENKRMIGEVGAGDTVGEFALLADEVRSATVYAIRESNVVRLRRPEFEDLVSQHPQIMRQIARIIAQRQQRAGKGAAEKSRTTSIAFVPLSTDVPLDEFAGMFVGQLKILASTLVLDALSFDERLGQTGAHAAALDSPVSMVIASWMTEQESNYEHLVYVADGEWSPWTQRCIRQADRIVLVANATDQPYLRDIEKQIQQHLPSVQIDLVLLHPADTIQPRNTGAWLDIRQVRAHHHVRRGTEQHYRRLARRLTGRAIGLVLSGGGARGFAHIGAIRALQEAGVEVDIVGGTSMGSLIGAAFVLYEDHAKLTELANDLASSKKLFDYTVPFVSIMASRKVTQMLENGFGDTKIEDLWTPYFCVSSNLSRSIPNIHSRGLLRRAVRASISIPAVFSPVMFEGDVLVDGGVMNNFPVDIMTDLCEGGPIIGIYTAPPIEKHKVYEIDDSISGWKVLRNRLNPFAKKMRVPSLPGTVLRALDINSAYRMRSAFKLVSLLIQPDVHSYGSLDFDSYKPLIQLGYEAAQPQFKAWMDEQAEH